MSAARMKDKEDFDLERFIDMFDQALTSNDERVVNALRSLMMMVILTSPEDGNNRAPGPFKRMMEDHQHIFRRLEHMEEQIRRYGRDNQYEDELKRRFYDKEQYFKWPAQYPTWDVNFDAKVANAKTAIQKINGGLNVANQIQPQPLTKGNTNGK